MSGTQIRENHHPEDFFLPLPLEEWGGSKDTLHRFIQIIGKIRLATSFHQNHWWHAPFSMTTRGITTSPMPYQNSTFSIDFDFIDHKLIIATSSGALETLRLDNVTVAQFYAAVFAALLRLGINITILARPFGLIPMTPFASDSKHAPYDWEYVNRYWQMLTQIDVILKQFSGRFNGKSSPVYLFWKDLDLAVTRFSGRPAPDRIGADRVSREAFSHEVISFGFSVDDARMHEPAFYSYTSPEPDDVSNHPLPPEPAYWNKQPDGSTALLMYDDLRKMAAPREALLDFLERSYRAGARTAGWDEVAFRTLELRSWR